MLLVGMPGSGKSMAAQAVAQSAGAAFFDLSPRNTEGKWPGKAAATMVRMAVRAAKLLAPSVIYIDEAEKVGMQGEVAADAGICHQLCVGGSECTAPGMLELEGCNSMACERSSMFAVHWTLDMRLSQVFVTDKRKIKQYDRQEPPGRIRKALLAEVRSLSCCHGSPQAVRSSTALPFTLCHATRRSPSNFIKIQTQQKGLINSEESAVGGSAGAKRPGARDWRVQHAADLHQERRGGAHDAVPASLLPAAARPQWQTGER